MTVKRLWGFCRFISGEGAACFALKESTWLVSKWLNAGVAAALGPEIRNKLRVNDQIGSYTAK